MVQYSPLRYILYNKKIKFWHKIFQNESKNLRDRSMPYRLKYDGKNYASIIYILYYTEICRLKISK